MKEEERGRERRKGREEREEKRRGDKKGPLFTFQIPGNQEFNSCLPMGGEVPTTRSLTCYLPPKAHTGKELELEVELGVKFRHSIMV